MIEVYKNLFVGSTEDWKKLNDTSGWKILQVSHKIHQQTKGYTKGCNKDDPEYYYCIRDNRMILNIIDNDYLDNRYIDGIIDTIQQGLKFIQDNIRKYKVLVHCDQGQSSSPTVALLYLIVYTSLYKEFNDIEEIIMDFIKQKYPNYQPAGQMKRILERIYCNTLEKNT